MGSQVSLWATHPLSCVSPATGVHHISSKAGFRGIPDVVDVKYSRLMLFSSSMGRFTNWTEIVLPSG